MKNIEGLKPPEYFPYLRHCNDLPELMNAQTGTFQTILVHFLFCIYIENIIVVHLA